MVVGFVNIDKVLLSFFFFVFALAAIVAAVGRVEGLVVFEKSGDAFWPILETAEQQKGLLQNRTTAKQKVTQA
jgi:hypothetical protein